MGNLRAWGKMAIVKQNQKMKKLTPKGRVAMFLGYPDKYSSDTIKAIYMNTWKETKARDILWMDLTYRDWKNRKHRDEHLMA